MNTDNIIKEIDTMVASRSSENFGIKVGEKVFSALIRCGKIKKAKFGIMGTKLFDCELLAYDGKYAVTLDWELADDEFVVGTPE